MLFLKATRGTAVLAFQGSSPHRPRQALVAVRCGAWLAGATGTVSRPFLKGHAITVKRKLWALLLSLLLSVTAIACGDGGYGGGGQDGGGDTTENDEGGY